jgi:hypothetical protein
MVSILGGTAINWRILLREVLAPYRPTILTKPAASIRTAGNFGHATPKPMIS